jgi:hypothetical protein
LLIEFLARNRALYDPRYAVNPVKQWLVYLKVYYPQAAALFAQVKRITDPEEMAMACGVKSVLPERPKARRDAGRAARRTNFGGTLCNPYESIAALVR